MLKIYIFATLVHADAHNVFCVFFHICHLYLGPHTFLLLLVSPTHSCRSSIIHRFSPESTCPTALYSSLGNASLNSSCLSLHGVYITIVVVILNLSHLNLAISNLELTHLQSNISSNHPSFISITRPSLA